MCACSSYSFSLHVCVERTTRVMYKNTETLIFMLNSRLLDWFHASYPFKKNFEHLDYLLFRSFVRSFVYLLEGPTKDQKNGNKNRCRYNENKNENLILAIYKSSNYEAIRQSAIKWTSIKTNQRQRTTTRKKHCCYLLLSYFLASFFIVKRQYHDAELRRQSTTRERNTHTHTISATQMD